MAPSAGGDGPIEDRVVDAALRCIARWGIAKTTLEDVAREAGCGRATIYRTFEGGKGAVMRAVLRREIVRLTTAVDDAVAGATTLEDVVVQGAVAAARFVRGHEALAFLLAHEPDVVLPHVAFSRMDRLFGAISAYAQPHLARFLPIEAVPAAAEWTTRIVLSYALNPSPGVDLTDENDARRFLTTFLVPALQPARVPSPRRASTASPRS
jgi:AcrR family transcriptional regulator